MNLNKCRNFLNTSNYLKRFYTKRKYPLDPEYLNSIPVLDYVSSGKNRNRVYVWGCVETGALGVRYLKRSEPVEFLRYPKRLWFAENYTVTYVACGFGFTAFAVEANDHLKVYGTGINTDSQVGCHAIREGKPLGIIFFPQPIPLPLRNQKSQVKKLGAGRAHLAVLTDEGLFLIGNNAYGQCGREVIKDENYVGNQFVHHIENLDGKEIVDVVCGQDHTLAITEDGSVYSCGWGADGQTGLGHYKSVSKFTKVLGDIENETIVKVACRSDFVMALNARGDVFGWGNIEYGQITTPSNSQQICSPIFMDACKQLGKIKDVASGGSSCFVLNEEGHVYAWGFGLLGTGPNVQQSSKPVLIPPQLFGLNDFNLNSKVTSISCGLSHIAAVTNEGDLYIWGRNRKGCLGLGHLKDQYFPLKVAIGGYVKEVFCGLDHTVAICKSFISD